MPEKLSDTDLAPSQTMLQLAIDTDLPKKKASTEAVLGLLTPPPRACDYRSSARAAVFRLISLVKAA